MKKDVKITLILIIMSMLTSNFGHAFELDETIDDEIRKNYNPTKLVDETNKKLTPLEKNIKHSSQQNNIEESLPELPNITKTSSVKKTSDIKNGNITATNTYPKYTGGNKKVKKGTTFAVTNINAISDWQTKGTKITFKTKSNTYGKNFTIPSGTTFYGEIIESHSPQITGNGGLVAIEIYSMIYNSQTIPLKGYISMADDKKIFLNNIKGDRTYLKTMWKKGNWGRTLFNKMASVSVNFGKNGATLALSPITLAYGTLCLGLNTLTSPICAFFSKGGHVSIPANSNFKIKLSEDIFI